VPREEKKMKSKMFLLDDGRVYVRGESGQDIHIQSLEEFNNYFPGDIDLSKEYYIDYEPEKKVFYYRPDRKDFSPLENQWVDHIPEYDAIINEIDQMRESQEDPYFGMSLDEARADKLKEIKRFTYNTITKHMPEWKQMKWNDYMRIYEKKEASEPLTPSEQALYNSFPPKGKKHATAYKNAQKAQAWIKQCIEINDQVEEELSHVEDIQGIKTLQEAIYPVFPV
jgi:hypothetical protein